MAKTKDGFLKFLLESVGETKLAVESYLAGGSYAERRDFIDALRQVGVDVDHLEDQPSVKVADVRAAREAAQAPVTPAPAPVAPPVAKPIPVLDKSDTPAE